MFISPDAKLVSFVEIIAQLISSASGTYVEKPRPPVIKITDITRVTQIADTGTASSFTLRLIVLLQIERIMKYNTYIIKIPMVKVNTIFGEVLRTV